MIPQQKLTYPWRYDGYDGLSYVTFELWDDHGKTKLKLTHEGVDTFPVDDASFAKENFSQGWTFILHTALKNFFKTNVNRPAEAKQLVNLLQHHFPETKISFDLDDCDKVLRRSM